MPDLGKAVEPLHQLTFEVVGLRLADPAETGFVVQQAVTQLPRGAVISVSRWSDVKRSVDGGNPLLGLLLALFGLVALGGALLAVGNAPGGGGLVPRQDPGMTKNPGLTPRQPIRMAGPAPAALAVAPAA